MSKRLFFLVFLFACAASSMLHAQENKMVILNLKNGYSVKGEVIEQTDQRVKIKTQNGDIFEYKSDEINNISSTKATSSSPANRLQKEFPKVLNKGDKILSIGIGIGGKLPYGSSEKLTVPPIPVSFEYVLEDNVFDGKGALGVGGFCGYSATKQDYNWSYYGKVINSRLIIGARGYVHYAFMAKLDTYAGVQLGYRSVRTKYSNSSDPEYYPNKKISDGSTSLSIFAGGRYFFNEKFAGTAELGWGVSILSLGVSIKL